MFENLRAFGFIVILASIVFSFCGKALKNDFDMAQFKRWRTTWFIVLAIAFLANNYWLYVVITGLYIFKTSKREPNKTAIFILLLFIVPPMGDDLPGLGVMNYLFTMNHPRILSLAILLPLYFSSKSSTSSFPIGKTSADKFLILYILLATLLEIRGTTFTDSLRHSFSAFFLDMFLPYFVASRGLKSVADIKTAFTALTIVSLIAAVLGVFEWAKGWVLFDALPKVLGSHGFGGYMWRGGGLRAISSLGHPIVFGLVMAASLGAFLLVSYSIKNKNLHKAGLFTLISGLFVSGSRGPWLGGLVFAAVFAVSADKPGKRVVSLVAVTFLVLGLLTVIPGGEKYYNMLPFIGKSETENVEYRQRLITNSMIVISQSPFFGSVNFMQTPEMQSMIQGEGIIDLVNTYLAFALMYGYVGAGLFTGFFLAIMLGIYTNMKRLPDKTSETYYAGRCILASMASISFSISTVSYILATPTFHFVIAGIGAAYAEIVRRQNLEARARSFT
jgi:hypothetical protein